MNIVDYLKNNSQMFIHIPLNLMNLDLIDESLSNVLSENFKLRESSSYLNI